MVVEIDKQKNKKRKSINKKRETESVGHSQEEEVRSSVEKKREEKDNSKPKTSTINKKTR